MEKFTYYFIYQPLDTALPTISFGGETTLSFEDVQNMVNPLVPENYQLVLSNYQKAEKNESQKVK